MNKLQRSLHWLNYAGSKFVSYPYMNKFEVPDFDVCADVFTGTGALALFYAERTTGKTFSFNDKNSLVVSWLKMLYSGDVETVFQDREWRNYKEFVNYQPGKKGRPNQARIRNNRTANWELYRKELENVSNVLRRHTCFFYTKTSRVFLGALRSYYSKFRAAQDSKESVPNLKIFVLADPPYISMLLKYYSEDYEIKDMIRDCADIRTFPLFMMFNDEISEYLKIFDGLQVEKYEFKRGGYVKKNRIELLFTNLKRKSEN
jgi:site-specific DNA-adenine methylase